MKYRNEIIVSMLISGFSLLTFPGRLFLRLWFGFYRRSEDLWMLGNTWRFGSLFAHRRSGSDDRSWCFFFGRRSAGERIEVRNVVRTGQDITVVCRDTSQLSGVFAGARQLHLSQFIRQVWNLAEFLFWFVLEIVLHK